MNLSLFSGNISLVYKIENSINGKVYIGSSVNPKERVYRHTLALKLKIKSIDIAKQYGICKGTISLIKNGKIWI